MSVRFTEVTQVAKDQADVPTIAICQHKPIWGLFARPCQEYQQWAARDIISHFFTTGRKIYLTEILDGELIAEHAAVFDCTWSSQQAYYIMVDLGAAFWINRFVCCVSKDDSWLIILSTSSSIIWLKHMPEMERNWTSFQVINYE